MASVNVAAWEDDPGDPNLQPPLQPISFLPPPDNTPPLPFKIKGSQPKPQVYKTGTPEFRYWAAAVALRRTADFWSTIVPARTSWQVGRMLAVDLDSGDDLNAFYTRGGGGDAPGLHFFHEMVKERTFFSGESPDVVCHEMGHAVLDALRPELFNAQFIEAAAFHESFGDMSALLSALQVPSFRQAVLTETSNRLNRASRLSRLAEQLGAAIRLNHPDAVDPDCLRNAANSFFYKDPQSLPPSAPASQLSSEPHSFSRVFTGAFLEALAGVFSLQGASSPDTLLAASSAMGQLLVTGILAAPAVPEFFSQVAAHIVDSGEAAPFNGKYRDILKSAFIKKGILSLEATSTLASGRKRTRKRLGLLAPIASFTAAGGELHVASITARQFGLTQATLNVHAAPQPKVFGVTASSLEAGPLAPPSAQTAAEIYTADIFKRGHVDVGDYIDPNVGVAHASSFKTHRIVERNGELLLVRTTFNCGFGEQRLR
ncbi:MAG: hypothetical protein WA736_06895 [Candidatus Acidiferrum sp.]